MTRNGKIARLPRALRQQLNQRLLDGEPGARLLEWLNALPKVQSILAADFEARPINAQNLTDWKKGGYRDWLAQQEALELAERLGHDLEVLRSEGRPPLTETLALWLATRYVVVARQVSQSEEPEPWSLLRQFCADLAKLRRGDLAADRLRLAHEKLDFQRQCLRDKSTAGKTPLSPKVMSAAVAALEQTGPVPQPQDTPPVPPFAVGKRAISGGAFSLSSSGGESQGEEAVFRTTHQQTRHGITHPHHRETQAPPTCAASNPSLQADSSLIKPDEKPAAHIVAPANPLQLPAGSQQPVAPASPQNAELLQPQFGTRCSADFPSAVSPTSSRQGLAAPHPQSLPKAVGRGSCRAGGRMEMARRRLGRSLALPRLGTPNWPFPFGSPKFQELPLFALRNA